MANLGRAVQVLDSFAQFLGDEAAFRIPKLHLVEDVREEFTSRAILSHNVVVVTVSEGLDKAESVRVVDRLQSFEFIRDPGFVADVAWDHLDSKLLENALGGGACCATLRSQTQDLILTLCRPESCKSHSSVSSRTDESTIRVIYLVYLVDVLPFTHTLDVGTLVLARDWRWCETFKPLLRVWSRTGIGTGWASSGRLLVIRRLNELKPQRAG